MKRTIANRLGRRVCIFVPVMLAATLSVYGDVQQDLDSLNKSFETLFKQGKYKEALPIAQKVLELSENSFAGNHTNTLSALGNLGVAYHALGATSNAAALYQRALDMSEKLPGQDSEMATLALNLAILYDDGGKFAQAEPLFERARKIREKAFGPDSSETADILNSMALHHKRLDDYAAAEALYRRALKITEKTLGPEHPDTARLLNNMAELDESMGDYKKAEESFRRALSIDERRLGPEHAYTLIILNNLAALLDNMGEYAEAVSRQRRALEVRDRVLGSRHPDTAISLNNLALVYQNIGDYTEAISLNQRALSIREEVLGTNDQLTATSLNNLGVLYNQVGERARAERALERALRIREDVLGPDHRDTANSLDNLAALYNDTGANDKAELLYQRALSIRTRILGENHPDTAGSLNNLSSLYKDLGDYAKATDFLQRSVQIKEKVLGLDHPATAKGLASLGRLMLAQENMLQVRKLAKEAQRASLKSLANVLSFASERQRLSYLATFDPYSLFATIGSGPELALAILRCKGVVLDSLMEDRLVAEASQNPEERATVEQLQSAKQRLMHLILEAPRDLTEEALQKRAAARDQLAREVEQLEGAMARRVAGLGRARRTLSVTVEEVKAAIPKDAALVEMLRYSHYLGKTNREPRYGAVVLTSSGEPKWVGLGAAAELEKNIQLYQQAARHKGGDKELADLLRTLHQQLWRPIQDTLSAETKTLILSPDSQLHFVSFATLIGPEDQFLGQKYSVRYVASGRDLLREIKPEPDSNTVVYANPDFSGKGVTPIQTPTNHLVALRSPEMRDLENLRLQPLPGTARESAALEAQAAKSAWPIRVYSGVEATEARLQEVSSPRVLHLATHGFFLPEADGSGGIVGEGQRGVGGLAGGPSPVILKNPMHRSGLALAGAQATFEAWKRGEAPPTGNDGVVTAEEVGGLKLQGTWLVTLSACDTGTGEARSGEGVLGLRRGFVQAGAQNLLLTLWAVEDQATPELMVDFYAAARKSGNAPRALADVQRDWLARLRKKRGLAEAVRIAGPFIMSSQGPMK